MARPAGRAARRAGPPAKCAARARLCVGSAHASRAAERLASVMRHATWDCCKLLVGVNVPLPAAFFRLQGRARAVSGAPSRPQAWRCQSTGCMCRRGAHRAQAARGCRAWPATRLERRRAMRAPWRAPRGRTRALRHAPPHLRRQEPGSVWRWSELPRVEAAAYRQACAGQHVLCSQDRSLSPAGPTAGAVSARAQHVRARRTGGARCGAGRGGAQHGRQRAAAAQARPHRAPGPLRRAARAPAGRRAHQRVLAGRRRILQGAPPGRRLWRGTAVSCSRVFVWPSWDAAGQREVHVGGTHGDSALGCRAS